MRIAIGQATEFDDLSDRGHMRGRLVEEVEGVADAVDRACARKDHPRQPPSREDRGAGDDEREQQHVADRVREIHRNAERVLGATQRPDDPVEGECGTDRGSAQPGDPTVQPCGREQPVDLPAEHQENCSVGEREEADVERVGEGRVGGRRAVPGLPGEHQVSQRPCQHRRSEHERDGSSGALAEGSREQEPDRGQLECDDTPAVDPGPLDPVAADDQADQVGRKECAEGPVRNPEPSRRSRDRPNSVRDQSPFTRRGGAHPRSFADSLSNSGCVCGTTMIPLVQVA